MGAYLSAPADDDLERIVRYIAERSRQNARELLGRIDARLERLSQFPRSGRLRDDLPGGTLRTTHVAPCILVYRVIDNGDVEVVRIAHDRQHLAVFLGFEDEHEGEGR